MEYSGFWHRAAAITLDTILFIILFFVLNFLMSDSLFYFNLIYQIICAFYSIGLTASKHQGTIGQKALKIKVTDIKGNAISLYASSLRYVLWMLPAWPVIVFASLPSSIQKAKVLEKTSAEYTDPEIFAQQIEALGLDSFMATFSFLSIIAILGGIVWMLAIGLTKEKTGIHDLICKQRVIKTKRI